MDEIKKVGRPRTGRVKKQMFLNPELAERLKAFSVEQVNALISTALNPPISTLKGLDLSHDIAEIEVKYKPNKLSETQITSAESAADILKAVWSDKLEWVEEFVVLLLDNGNHPLGYVKLFQGGLNRSIIDSRIVFGIALVAQASGFIISHNHPSGNLLPSQADIDATSNLLAQSRIMGISLLDHIIISPKGFFSFKERGLIY